MQSVINNAISVSTGLVPNKVIYCFRSNDTLRIISDLPPKDFSRFRLVYKKQAEKTIAWANAVVKHKYDERHLIIDLPIKSIFLETSPRVHDSRGIK